MDAATALEPGGGKGKGKIPVVLEDEAVKPAAAAASKEAAAAANNSSNNASHHHAPVVPAYPYNVSMSPFIPGHSSAKTDGYFEQHVPDDSNVQTRLPSICVDYLSHEWKEDDVWASWKAMTKHKSEIANGVRLENASWRTWAKQRGRLKTISPETLNWLKDSDVTWLYGPLHTAVDPVPIKRGATAEEYLGLDKTTVTGRHPSKSGGKPQRAVKPILKHRSLSDILSVPTSGSATPTGEYYSTDEYNEEDDADEDELATTSSTSEFDDAGFLGSAEGTPRARSPSNGVAASTNPRAGVIKTKSDSALSQHANAAIAPPTGGAGKKRRRKRSTSSSGSPPRISVSTAAASAAANTQFNSQPSPVDASGAPLYSDSPYDLPAPSPTTSSSSSNGAGSQSSFSHRRSSSHAHDRSTSPPTQPGGHTQRHSSTISNTSTGAPKKRHITFNHKVEQCISVDVEDAPSYFANHQQAQPSNGARGGGGGQQQPYSNTLHRYGSGSARQGGSSSSSTSTSSSSSSSSDEDEDEEDVLTFKSSSPRSPSFMKPFLASPSDPNGPTGGRYGSRLGGNAATGGKGGHRQKGHAKEEPHTIAKLEPTTLKESELLPGPTPIVVVEDGRITALYGTEDDYIYDAEEHGGVDLAQARGAGVSLAGKSGKKRDPAIAVYEDSDDDEDEDDDDDGITLVETTRRPPTDLRDEDEDERHGDIDILGETGVESLGKGETVSSPSEFYNAVPASTGVAGAKVVQGGISGQRSLIQSDPVTSSSRFEDPNVSIVRAPGVADQSGDYFAGPDVSGTEDAYDSRTSTLSQIRYSGAAAGDSINNKGANAGNLQASNTLSAAATSSKDPSPSASDSNILLATSPRSAGIPAKSILKKTKENTSGEYYPPLPPASTRASRAHAAMFTEDGEVIERSPARKDNQPLPAELGRASGSDNFQTSSPLGESSMSSNNTNYTSSMSIGSPNISTNNAATYAEPTRGRSISRGSSSSSLIDRVGSSQSLVTAEGYVSASRTRSTSGGHSVSPVPSYSPPYTASLNSLGTGTAVLHSQPVDDVPRGRTYRQGAGVQSTRPSVIREAIDSSSASDSSDAEDTAHEDNDDAGDMDLREDDSLLTNRDAQSQPQFARQSKAQKQPPGPSPQRGAKPAGNANAAASVGSTQDRKGFHERPTSSAADVGRSLVGALFRRSSSSTGTSGERPAGSAASNPAKAAPSSSLTTSSQSSSSSRNRALFTLSSSASTETQKQVFSLHSSTAPERRQKKLELAGEGEGLDDDDDDVEPNERLFDSPYMPSSPTFLSSTNLPALAAAAAQSAADSASSTPASIRDRKDTAFHVRWADPKPEQKQSSVARRSLLKSVASPSVSASAQSSSQPAYRTSSGHNKARSSPSARAADDEDDLSDPANNGYSYSYGFDLSDDDDEDSSKGVVGRAVDLVGALWNVGSGMLWRSTSSSGPAEASEPGTHNDVL